MSRRVAIHCVAAPSCCFALPSRIVVYCRVFVSRDRALLVVCVVRVGWCVRVMYCVSVAVSCIGFLYCVALVFVVLY